MGIPQDGEAAPKPGGSEAACSQPMGDKFGLPSAGVSNGDSVERFQFKLFAEPSDDLEIKVRLNRPLVPMLTVKCPVSGIVPQQNASVHAGSLGNVG